MAPHTDPLARRPPGQPARLASPADALALFGPTLIAASVEWVLAAYLLGDSVLALRDVTVGDAMTTVLPIAMILRDAVRCGADSLVLAHNHPGGDPTPSAEDLRVTRRFADAAAAVGIRLVDHVVVARGGCRSLRLMGLL